MQKRIPGCLLCFCTWLALTRAAEVSWVHPKSGSVAGGSFVVLLGSGFRYPAGPEPIGPQTVHFGNSQCTIIEASAERLLCETGPAESAAPYLACLRLSEAGPCEPACEGCTFQFAEEKTPFISWISTRALRAGDQVAFGAAQTGALGPGVTAVDRAVVEIGGYICDASARQVENSDELVQSRTLNCALDLAGPSLATLQIRSLAVGYDDPRCAHYPCIDYSTSEGYGNAVFRTWQGTAQKASAFLQPNFQAYDLAIYPDILGIRPGRSGILNGAPVHIRGSTFDTDLTKNIVTVGEDPCEVKSANATNIICELEEVQSNVSCVEFEIFIGANPASGVKLVQHDGNSLEVAACHAEGTGRSFTVNLNASAKTGYYWVEDSCQAEGRQIKGHMAEESEDRLTFCCAMDGSSCEGPRYGQVTTTQPSYWTGWGPWVQLETTTPDPLFGTCLQPQSHKDAEMTCQLTGMRLCTRKELNSGLCCAADCIGEGSAEVGTWSSETGYLQELAILSDDGQPWTEELWIRCDENCQFPFNVTYPDSNGTTLTTTKYTPEQIALWEFAPWLRPADYEPPKEAEEILPLGPPVPEPLLPPSPPLKAPFPGGRGLVYQVFYNPYNLPLHRALGYENPGYPQSPMETGVLADMLRGALHHVKFESVPSTSLAAKRLYVTATPLSDDTGYDLYAEEITGYFIAPYTGVYTFYLAADDEADLSLSNSDMAAMKVIVRASSTDQAMPRFTPLAWFGKHCAQGQGLPEDANAPCSVSAPLQFKAGDRTLLRIRHREHLGADWLRVGLRIRSATTAEGLPPPPDLARSKSFVEVQRLTMTASVVRERHRIDLDRVLRGSFFVRVRRFENNFLREGTSGVVYYGDNPEKLATVLWETQDLYGRVLQCQPTVTQSEGFERFSYFVTFPCPKPADGNAHAAAMTIIPGLDVIGTSVVTWVMNSRLLQSSSPVVTGSFRLSFAGYWTQDIPYHGWDLIEPELLKLPISEVRLWPFQEVLQEGREGWSVGLLLGGGEDMPQIQVDIRQLEGPGVRLISETMANGSADLFMEELPADWFRTVHSQPQVVVESNGVVAMSLDASVRRSEDFTPRLMELQPLAVQVGTELQLRFDRVDGNHLRALLPHQRPFDVWVGPSPCNLTSYSCENGVERNCGAFPEVWNVRCTISDGRAGPQDLKVVIDGQGCPQFTNVTIAMPLPHIEFVPMIYSVQPSIGSWAGGTVVVLTGYGLQGDEACELVHFGERRLLEVPSDYYEEEDVPAIGRRIRCMVPAAPMRPKACEIRPEIGNCDLVDDLAVPVTVAGHATDFLFNYSSSMTPVVTSISPSRSAAISGMVHVKGFGFPSVSRSHAFAPCPTVKHLVLHIGDQTCRIEESSSSSLSCFLIRHPPVPSGQSEVELWMLGAGFAVIMPETIYFHAFAVTKVSPDTGSWHGGAVLDVSGEGFHPDIFRHDIFMRVTLANGTMQDLPCPLVPAASLQSRRLRCEAPALTEPLLEYVRSEGGLEEILGNVTVRLNGIESSCGLGEEMGCVYRFSRRSTPSVVNVWPLHGASLDAEAPTVRIIVAGWDGSKADAEVFFGSQQCEVNLTKRLVQPCPECGQGHCISNVLNADMAAVAGEMAQSAVACKCNDGWYGENCGKPCTCVYPGTLSCDDGANGDGTCTCADLHNGTNCELCDMGYYPSRLGGLCDTFCDRNDTCSNNGQCNERGRCHCDLWYFGDSCDCTCNGRGICEADGSCTCDARWSGDRCETQVTGDAVEECGNCSMRGICVESGDDFACRCLDSFFGEICERSCTDCQPDNTLSCSEGFCYCKQGFWGPLCENSCTCSLTGTDSCDPSDGSCRCRNGWQGTTCSQCATNYYPEGLCNVFCDGATTCHGFGTCSPAGQCVCTGARSVESFCNECLPHYYPAQDVLQVLGMTDPPEIFVEEIREVDIDCPGEEYNESNESNETEEMNETNRSDSNGSSMDMEEMEGRRRCRVNITVNVSVNTTDLVEPITNLIVACSRYCDPSISCSGFGTCDRVSAECICDNDHFSSDCSGVCSDHCYAAGTELCSLPSGATTPECTCKPSYWDADCRWSCTCTEAGTLKCNDGSTGDGSCQCKSGFIGFACDSCAAYMYPPGECFRRCEEGVDCFRGSCTPFTGICECETGFEGSNCGCSVDMSPGDSCGGRGFCTENGTCQCDVRVQGASCADSKSYQLAETNCPYCNNVGICIEETAGQFACSCAKQLGYYGVNCEVFCSTCNPSNTRNCAIANQVEQCFCEDWWWGEDCSRPCPCVREGSTLCLASTGQCECKQGWAGVYCEQCAPGYYPEGACDVECDFGATCNLNGICGPQGTCICDDLWEGEGCTYCTFDGRPVVGDNSTGYPPCSTRCSDSTICNGHGSCTAAGLCDCDPGWYGGPVVCWDQELAAANGWVRTTDLADCNIQLPLGAGFRSECSMQCTCTYPGTHYCREGRTGDGLCVCHYGWGGMDCERCSEGFFPSPSVASPSCTTFCMDSTTCNSHGRCNDYGICECDSGWAGENCDRCDANWFPLGTCDVYCTEEETCSYHGRCSSEGLCLCDDGWMTGMRSRFQYNVDELSLEDFFPGGNATFGDEELWRCLVSCAERYGFDSETDRCVERCMDSGETTTATTTGGEVPEAENETLNDTNMTVLEGGNRVHVENQSEHQAEPEEPSNESTNDSDADNETTDSDGNSTSTSSTTTSSTTTSVSSTSTQTVTSTSTSSSITSSSTSTSSTSTSSTSSTSSSSSSSSTTSTSTTSSSTSTDLNMSDAVNLSSFELCVAACQDALAAAYNASGNLSTNLTIQLAARCFKQCMVNRTIGEPKQRFCDILDVTLFRLIPCPLSAGLHSVSVKPTTLGFADRASRSKADFHITQELRTASMEPYGGVSAGGKVVTITGVGFDEDPKKVHVAFEDIGPCEVIENSPRHLKCLSPHISDWRFQELWNTSTKSFVHSDGTMVVSVPVHVVVGELVPALLASHTRCHGHDSQQELLEGLTLDECAQQCIMRFAGQRCSAFSYGFRGRVSQLCSIISDPNGCWRLVPDGEFHSYSIRDAGSNSSSPAVWPVLMPITTTVTSTTRTTITITSTEGNTTSTTGTTTSKTISTTMTTSSVTTTFSTKAVTTSSVTATSTISSTVTSTATTSTTITKTTSSTSTRSTLTSTSSTTTTSVSTTSTSQTSTTSTSTSSSAESSTRTTSTATIVTSTSTVVSETATTSTTFTSSSSTATSSTMTSSTVTMSSTTTSSITSTTSTTSTTTTSLDPNAMVFLVEAMGPKALSMVPNQGFAGTVVVITGQDFGAQEGIVLLLEPGSASSNSEMECDVIQWQDAEVSCRIPALSAGAYEARVRVPGLGDAVVAVPFVLPLTIEAPQELVEVNMAGGEELNFSGTGLGDDKVVTLCGSPCEQLNASESELSCRTTRILLNSELLEGLPSQDLRPGVHVTGAPHRHEEVLRAVDGAVDTDVMLGYVEDACHIDFDAGPARRFRLTDIAYFAPAEATLREGLIGTSFQSGDYPVLDENYTVEYLEELDGDFPECNESNGSNESNFSNCTQPMPSWRKEPLLPITWTSFWTLGRPSLGWNAKRIDPPILSRRVRLRGMPAAGACQIREVELRGQIFSESCAMEVSSSFPVPAVGVSRGAPLQQLAVQIKGVTQVEEQLLMMPGGSLGVWMRVDTNEPTELLVEATVPENFEPKTVPLQIFAKRYERGEFLSTDIMAQFEVFSDTPRLTRTSTTLVAPMGLWFLEFVSASPMQLGDLVALTPGVDFLVQSLRIPNVVHPSAKKTPFVASIDPPEGPFMGGSNIVLQGQGFLCNGTTSPEELAVNLSATPCVIYTATDTEIRCRSAPQTELGGGEVTLKSGCGEALVAPGVSFIYVTRWSIPSDWPYAEPPIPTDETVIPSGSHVILDYPTPKLSLLRVEGHLEMDLMAEELSLTSERLWLRGGRLTAERAMSHGQERSMETSFSIVMGEANISQVFSHRVEAQGLRRYGLMVTDRYPGECAWAEAQGSLLVRSPFRRSTVLTSPAVAGSKALQIRSPIDVRPGERILIMGGSAAAPEEHVVMAVEPDGQSGQVLMLEDSIIHDREGGIHQLDAIQEQILYNFGEVDLSATVASLSGRAHFYGAQGGAFIDCIGSSGSCGLEGLVFSSCGQVAPGTSGVPCVNLKAVRPSAFVTDSVFLDAAGPAAVLQAQLNGELDFARNVIVSPRGPGVTSTVRHDLPRNSLMVQNNQVASPRKSEIGLPWFQHRVAFKMATGAASYVQNFATDAEACFFFDPRVDSDLSSQGPLMWPLHLFRGNAVHGCHMSLLVPTLRAGDLKVFEDFTVFASDYAAFIHGCDRCRMLRWMWVECNVGILDQDSMPLLEDPPWIEHATAVGTRDMWGAPRVSLEPQIILSPHEGRFLRNVTFFLFGSSPCLHGGLRPVTIRTELMRFFQSDVEVFTVSPAGYTIFADLDGTLSGHVGGFVTGDKNYNRHASCQRVGIQGAYRILCPSSVFIRAIQITGVEPADVQGQDLTIWTIYGHGTVPYSDGWFFTVVGAKLREDMVWPYSRWSEEGPTPIEWRMLPYWYTLRADSPVDWSSLRISYGAPGLMLETEWVGLLFPYQYTPVRQFEAVGISGSCFEPYYDWLGRGGFGLWAPEIFSTITRTSTTTFTSTSTTSTTSTSISTTSETSSTTSSTTSTTSTGNETFNDTNESNETNTSTSSTTFTTVTTSSITNTSSTTTKSSSTTTSSTISRTTTSTSRTSTSRTSSTTTTSYLGTRTSTSTETTITMTTTTSSTATTVPRAAPLRTLDVFPEPRYGCAALTFQFEMCERPTGWAFGPCLPNGPIVGWTNYTEMVNSSLFANGTLAVMFGNQRLGDFRDPMVADLVNTGCGPSGCAFIEEVRAAMGPPGNWTRPDSWPGQQLPRSPELEVVIPPFYHIIYNNFTAIGVVGDLKVFGKLSMAEDEGLKLLVKSIQVFQGGVFQVGTSWAPHRTTAIISFWGVSFDSGPAYISTDTDWGRKVLGVYEGNVSLHGKTYSRRWSVLYQSTEPGDVMIRVAEDVGDWPAGAEIAITTEEYPNMTVNATGTERRFIREIVFYPPSTEIILDRPLNWRHFAGQASDDPSTPLLVSARVVLLSRSIVITTEEASTGADRFPDPERGVPEPGHGGDWFGHHMVISGSSYVSMSWVQFAHGGQDGRGTLGQLARFPALRIYQPSSYTRVLPRPYIDSVVFSNSYVGGIELIGRWGLDLLNCVFCETRGRAVNAGTDMGGVFVINNLALDSRPEPPPLVPVSNPTYEPSAVFQFQARPVVFSGNLVAGCPDIGILMRPYTCEEVEQDTGELDVNEVHSCVIGFFVLRSCTADGGGPASCPGSLDCVHLQKMKAWKNAHVGILFVDHPSNMVISDVVVFDNHIGITGNFHRQIGDMAHTFLLRDSKVFGSTAISGCNASMQCLAVGPGDVAPVTCNSLPGPEFRRIGVLLPIITNRGKTCEDGPVRRTCPLANLPERDCAMPWEVRYGNRATRMSSQRIENVFFGGFHAEKCNISSSAFDEAMLLSSALPPTCENCTGKVQRTLDGGLTACSDKMRLLNWESLDADCCGFYRRELGLLRATRLVDHAIEEARPMFDESCPRGLEYGRSSYVIRMETGYSHSLRFMATPQLPRLSRIHFFAESVADEVLLQIPLGRLRRPTLYVYGINFDIMRRNTIPNPGDSHGAMFLDRDNLMLYMMTRGMPGGFKGSGVIILMLLEVIVAEVVIFIPLEEFNEFDFLADISRSLNVSEERISLVDIRYDGKKWLAGPNGRRLEMVDTLAITFEVSEDPVLNPNVLADLPMDSLGSYNPFFEDAVQNPPAEADAVSTMRSFATTLEVRGVSGLNLTWPVADFQVTAVPEVPTTVITRLTCGVNLQGEQVCRCDDGWFGPECDQLCNCTGDGIASCNEGPQGNGTCNCKDGYIGERCEECKQYFYNLQNGCSIYCHPDDYCSGHGECTTHPVTHQINGCLCQTEWAGADCSECSPGWYPARVCNVYCSTNFTCNGKGQCSDLGTCLCDPGRRGARCDLCEEDYYPPGECSRRCFRGNCIRGQCDAEGFCQCSPNWFGSTCSVSCPRCSLDGSNGCDDGREGNGTCICKVGFDGPVCNEATSYQTTEWSVCDGPCGGAASYRSRLVRCYNTRTGAILEDSKCEGEKPPEQEACVTDLCSCKEPPMINHSDYEQTLLRCPYLPNGNDCVAICSPGYSRTGTYKCMSSRYIQRPICLPLGDTAQEKEVIYSYVILAGIDLSLVFNISSWYESIRSSLRQVLASVVVPPGLGQRVMPQQLTFLQWYEVEMPTLSRRLQGDIVAMEIPFNLEIEDDFLFQKAEDMLNFYAASPTASQSTILTALQAKLEELCFTVLPDLRPLRCTAPQMLLIGEALRTTLYLPPVPITTTAVPTTTEQRAIIEVNLQEGLPAWAVGLLIVLIVLVGFCGSYIWRLHQKKQQHLRKEARIQELKQKSVDDARSDEQKEYDAWMEVLTDNDGRFITGYKDDLKLPDGSIYSGELSNGDPHGVGKMIWIDGRTYRGKWQFGQPHGQGVMSSVAPKDLEYDTWIYSGQFHEGLRNGTGRCEWPAVGAWYEGDWSMDGEHGLGELGSGATESQDGDPQVWCMYNGERQENVAQSRVKPGPEDQLMVVVLQAKGKAQSELDEVQLMLPRYGFGIGNPHVWIPRYEHALLVTWVDEDGALDEWNKAQIRQVGSGASLVLQNSTIWCVNGIRGDISRMTEMLLSPTEMSLELEVWGPAHLRFESMRDDLSKRIGWFRKPDTQMEFVGMQYQQKSRQAREQEQLRPWLPSMPATRPEEYETQSFLERAPARMTNQPGLPALLRMPEVPAPPSHLVASITAPKASKVEPKKKPSKSFSPPEPLRWPQAPAPPTPPVEETRQDERLRRVAEASTPPMSPR